MCDGVICRIPLRDSQINLSITIEELFQFLMQIIASMIKKTHMINPAVFYKNI